VYTVRQSTAAFAFAAIVCAGCSGGKPVERRPVQVLKADEAKITIGKADSAPAAKPAETAAPPAENPPEAADKNTDKK